jgi:hypothetical protein
MKITINSKTVNLTGKAAATVRNQPGYHATPKEDYALSRTAKGGIRLYAWISGNWTDASLNDIPVSDLPGVKIN